MFDYKQYFYNIWMKGKHLKKLEEDEQLIYDIMQEHIEYYYHYECANTDDFQYSDDAPNPFFHITLHLILDKLLNDPKYPFFQEAFAKLLKANDKHSAEHLLIDKILSSLDFEGMQDNLSILGLNININELRKYFQEIT